MVASVSPTTPTTAVMLNQDDATLGMENSDHNDNGDAGDRTSDILPSGSRVSDHLPPPKPTMLGSTSSDGNGDGSPDGIKLQSANLETCVTFEGDVTSSCTPHKFKPYTANDKLGQGSYGTVFVVECEHCSNLYARKVISFRGVNKQQRERLQNTTSAELNCYRTLSHPHVLKYVHHEPTEHGMDIFTEFCELLDLDHSIGEFGALPIAIAWKVTEGLVSALARCHYGMNASERLGLVGDYLGFEHNWERVLHRDVKPANVLLAVRRDKGKGMATELEVADSSDQEGEEQILIPKLGDFGTCFKLEREGKNPSSHFVGTKAFWAPEIRREANDPSVEGRITSWSEKSDIWGLGGVLYEMLTTGVPEKNYPKSSKERKSLLAKTLPEERDFLLLEILSDCLEPDPSTRVTALHILPVTLKADTSAEALTRSASFWKTLTRAPSTVPIESIVTHFIGRYLPILAQDKTHFTPSEVCYIMGLVSQHAPLKAAQCYQYLAAGFQGPLLQDGTVFHSLALLPAKDAEAARYAFDESKWATSQSLAPLLLQKNKDGLFPSAVAMYRGNIDLSARLTQVEESARRQHSERNTQFAVAKAREEASAFSADEFDAMFSFMASRMTSGLTVTRTEAANILITASQKGFGNLVKKLVEFGVEPSICGQRSETALHIFAYSGGLDTVKYLIGKGAAVEAMDKKGCTPLHWAAWEGQDLVVGELIAAGADVNSRDRDGRTPLFGAAGGGFAGVVRRLVRARADTKAGGGRSNETPLERAKKNGHAEVVEFLKTVK